MQDLPEVTLQEKLEFLLRPDAYPDRPESIEGIETHFAWVFLSKHFVYKLKKPIRFQHMDFTNLETRRGTCELEVVLNRRLAEAVYIAVVPLCAVGTRLSLEGDGRPIEWLVKMHRLPADRMLDRAALEGRVTEPELRSLVNKLAGFYRSSNRAPWSGQDYVSRLTRESRDYGNRLDLPHPGLHRDAVRRVVAAQQEFIERNAERLESRIDHGRVVDAHGDLKPEHICLTEPPQIIDCLEFSQELRLLDSAAEVAFLALECDRLGCSAVGERVLGLYREILEDPIPHELLHFYRSQRALIRAHLSAWHLIDGDADEAERWIRQTNWYVESSEASIQEALSN